MFRTRAGRRATRAAPAARCVGRRAGRSAAARNCRASRSSPDEAVAVAEGHRQQADRGQPAEPACRRHARTAGQREERRGQTPRLLADCEAARLLHLAQVAIERVPRGRQRTRRCAEPGADLRRLGAVAVLLGGRQGPDEQGVGSQLAVDQRGVDPGEQRRIRGVVGGADRVGADRALEAAVHPPVDGVDSPGRPPDLGLAAEGERQHGRDRPAHAPDVGQRSGIEPAVGTDARGDQRDARAASGWRAPSRARPALHG